jgi:hypothetical protein
MSIVQQIRRRETPITPAFRREFSNSRGEAFVDMLTTRLKNELPATAGYDALCLSL